MTQKNIVQQIKKGSQEGGKTYDFDEEHDSTQPAQMWFQESSDGLTLFVVFYSQACRWSRCLGCNLPSKSSQYHVDYKDIIAQIDHVFNLPEVIGKKEQIKKLIISNNGSILDQETFSSTALLYLLARINLNFSNLSVLTLETRPEFVEIEELEFLSRSLAEGDTSTTLELGVGFEAYDQTIRNEVFNKGLTLEVFESFIAKVAPYNYRVKCYFMQKPIPNFSDEEAVHDITKAIDYLNNISNRYGVKINMHLNPTYAAYGTPLEKYYYEGSFIPPTLHDVAHAVYHARKTSLTLYVGLYDEGLAVEGGSFIRKGDESLISALESFNRCQDYQLLKGFLL
jgi:radical SAM enzyme (TIGR01210 family)